MIDDPDLAARVAEAIGRLDREIAEHDASMERRLEWLLDQERQAIQRAGIPQRKTPPLEGHVCGINCGIFPGDCPVIAKGRK